MSLWTLLASGPKCPAIACLGFRGLGFRVCINWVAVKELTLGYRNHMSMWGVEFIGIQLPQSGFIVNKGGSLP